MRLAASSAFFTASGEEISGLGRPFGTPTAVRIVTIGVALSRAMAPEVSAPGNGAMMMETSSACPFATLRRPSTPLAKVTFTVRPLFASNAVTIFCVGARIGPTASSVISPCACAPAVAHAPHASAMATDTEERCFIATLRQLALGVGSWKLAIACVRRLLCAPIVFRRRARRDLHGLHLLDVFRVERLGPAERALLRDAVFGPELAHHVVLAGQEARHLARRNDRPVRADLARKRRNDLIGVEDPARFSDVRRGEIRSE